MPRVKKGSARSSAVPETGRLAKLFRLGMGALWMTESGVRKAVQELRLPREAATYLVEQFDRRKGEIFSLVREEVHTAFSKLDLRKLIEHIVQTHEIEIHATVKFKPKK